MSSQSFHGVHRKMCYIEIEMLKSDRLDLGGVTLLFDLFSSLNGELNKCRNITAPFSEYSEAFVHAAFQKAVNLRTSLKEILKDKVNHVFPSKYSYYPRKESPPSLHKMLTEKLHFMNLFETLFAMHLNRRENEILFYHLKAWYVSFCHVEEYIINFEPNPSTKEIQLDVCRDLRIRGSHLEKKLNSKLGVPFPVPRPGFETSMLGNGNCMIC